MSGSALCWWANLPNQRRTTVSLAEAVNCPIDSSAKLLECLRSKPAVEIMKAQNQLYAWRPGKMETEPMNIWSPRPDPEAGEDAILPVQPTLAMEVGQIHPVPFLVGIAESEGIWRAANYLTQVTTCICFLYNTALPSYVLLSKFNLKKIFFQK
ncbi:esterase E4 [Eurytemora carolleeae]|uniref:esterase E4 n=1 Tax=Eurytemora carolleeae TaxID=1294199 RepID=UPI000C77C15C|nr:esterase E4 [Eurytemora carolleeae]|eukprot:XP_023346297.1 esterase E4-like [Eurytemora affinis]